MNPWIMILVMVIESAEQDGDEEAVAEARQLLEKATSDNGRRG